MRRLHLAFRAFLRRCKKGQTPGFPRFKSFERFSGWGYKTHGQGFRFTPGDGDRHGKLRLSGIGTIPIRGRARTLGEVKTCDLQRKNGRWYACLTIACTPKRAGGTGCSGLDWGVQTFATLARDDHSFVTIKNPRFVRAAKSALERAQRKLSAKKKGSKNRAKGKRLVATIARKTAGKRRDFLHKQSAKLVSESSLIATETLAVKNMIRSAKGTIESPGRNVAQKAGLNREILATSPGAFLAMLRYKAAEAGIEFVEVPSRTVKPSQRCSSCGNVRKKTLAERQHICECGLVLSRDQNAARVNLLWALAHTGREPTGRLAPCA